MLKAFQAQITFLSGLPDPQHGSGSGGMNHKSSPADTAQTCECGCGVATGKDERGRPRRFVSGHNSRGTLRKPRVQYSCQHCKKVVEATPTVARKRLYCSAHCRNEFRRNRVGPVNPHYAKVKHTCPNCAVEFLTLPKLLKRSHDTYCSMECGRQGRSRKIAGKARRLNRPETGIHAAKKRDGFACRLCGFDTVVQGHHIIPKRAGGLHNLENIITLCPNHHAMTHAGLVTTAELQAAMKTEPHDPMPLVYRATHQIGYRVLPS